MTVKTPHVPTYNTKEKDRIEKRGLFLTYNRGES